MGDLTHRALRAISPRWLLALVLLAPACAEDLPGFAPPNDQLHYPVSLAVTGEHLLVVSSNLDQRYNAGSVMALSLPALAAIAPAGDAPAVTRELPATGRSQIKISSFGGQLVAIPGPTETEVYVAARRGNRVTRASFAGGLLACANGAVTERILGTDCTPGRTAETIADGELIAEDPFSAAFVPGVSERGVVVVGSLRALTRVQDGLSVAVGVLSLVLPEAFDVGLVAEQQGESYPRPMRNVGLTGLAGVLSMATIPGTAEVIAAAGDADAISPTANLAQVARLRVRTSTAGLGVERLATIDVGSAAGADATRGVAVSADGQRAYVSLRLRQSSGSAVLFNSALAVVSIPEGRTLSVLELGEELVTPVLLERPGLSPSRLVYIADLRSDRVFVVDASSDAPLLVHTIEPAVQADDTQRLMAAPAQLLVVPSEARAAVGGRTLAFVANFGNSTLAILDLSDEDPRKHRLVARVGRALSEDGVEEVE